MCAGDRACHPIRSFTSTDGGASWNASVLVSTVTSHKVAGGTSGATAKLGVHYYFHPNAKCSSSTCQLEVGFISSANAGSTWSAAQTVAGPMSLSQIASTTQGPMVGDYTSCSVVNGKSVAIFAVGKTPANGRAFDEAMYTAGPLT